MKTLNRREFLAGTVLAAAGGVLAACASPGPYVTDVSPARPVVKETVEVEKIVEVPVEVEKLVEVERIVEKVVGEPLWSPPDLSGREFLIWGLQFDPHVEAYHRLADKFEEYTGAKATVEPQGWPIQTNIITGMAAGLVPDVCCIMGAQISSLIEEGAILAVDDLYDTVGANIDTWFGPVAIQAYQYFGKTWGVPTEGNCVSGVTNMNLDFLAECSQEIQDLWPPNVGEVGLRDFDTMWRLAEALQRTDDDGNVTRWGLSGTGWGATQLLGIMRTLGRDWWDPEARTFHLTSDEAVEAMRLYVTIPVFELGIETQLQEPCTDAQYAGKVAICNGNVTQPGIGRDLGMNLDTCVYPSAIPGREALFVAEGGWGFVLPSQGKNQDVGIEFLKFMTTYEGQKEYARIYGGLISACVGVNSDPELFPIGDPVGEAMRRSGIAQTRTVYYGGEYGSPGEMADIVGTAVENVRTGAQTEMEALSEAQMLLEEMLVRYDS